MTRVNDVNDDGGNVRQRNISPPILSPVRYVRVSYVVILFRAFHGTSFSAVCCRAIIPNFNAP